jgi:hypothetical protein
MIHGKSVSGYRETTITYRPSAAIGAVHTMICAVRSIIDTSPAVTGAASTSGNSGEPVIGTRIVAVCAERIVNYSQSIAMGGIQHED